MIKNSLNVLEKLLHHTACTLFAIFHLLILTQVISRYVFNHSLAWTEQASRYLFIWMIMLYLSVILRRKGNMAFDLLITKLPLKFQDLFLLFTEIMIGCFGAYWCYWSFRICLEFQGKVFDGIGIPKTWVYSAQPVGAFFLFLFSLELIADHWIEIRKGVRR